MEACNANNATWYMLRYPEHFTPGDPAEPPWLEPTLFYDDARGVLELLPVPLEREIRPLAGLAVAADGTVYVVEPRTGRLLVRCRDAVRLLLCEPQVLAGPRGLALDRCGHLYVADARAGRVVVLRPGSGQVQAILDAGVLQEPVDVAVSPTGRIYVADRQAGRIAVYTRRWQRQGSFAAQNGEKLPETPRPVAVMIDADETVLVADANHPRLLRFSPAGEPLADVVLTSLTATLPDLGEALKTLQGLERFFGAGPRFVEGACEPPRPSRDVGELLAQMHRMLRLARLALGRGYAESGTYISPALDGGLPGTVWHRLEVGADLPAGATLTIETATADEPSAIDLTRDDSWQAPRDLEGRPQPFTEQVPEQLIQSPPGRYLWVRVRLISDGRVTPSLRWLRVLYPRVSYLELLPRVYRRDPEGAWFLERFLALFEWLFTRSEDRCEEFSRQLNPEAAPLEVIDWLACLIDLSFDPSWPLARRRALVAAAMELYRRRGTVEGLRRYVEIYTGVHPEIIEAFLARPRQPAILGVPGSVLGCPFHLSAGALDHRHGEQLFQDYAHRFTVLVYLDDPCAAETVLPVVDRIVTVNKPAHTHHTICPIYPQARVGVQSRVGLDLVVGGAETPGTRLGARGSSLGGDVVLQ